MKDAITGLMFFYIVCFQIFFFSLKKKRNSNFTTIFYTDVTKVDFCGSIFSQSSQTKKKLPIRKKKPHLTDRRIFSIFSGSAPDDNIHIQGFGNSTLNNFWYFRQKSTHLTPTQFQNLNWKLLASVGQRAGRK